jgi:hypothetical protein
MRSRLTCAALALALSVAACSQDAPTSTTTHEDQLSTPAVKKSDSFLSNIPVSGTLSDATAFTGTLTVTRLAYDQATGSLLVSGVLRDATGRVVATIRNVEAQLFDPDGGTCDILILDIGPIHLDLLGLVVDLSAIHLEITGQTGQGELLGNLLCALAGLLDPPGPLSQILDIIRQINDLLGRL